MDLYVGPLAGVLEALLAEYPWPSSHSRLLRQLPGVFGKDDYPHPRVPSIQTIPTLRPKVSKYHLVWAIWSPRDTADDPC